MLHSEVYNLAFTKDLFDAQRDGNVEFLTSEINRLSALVGTRTADQHPTVYDPDFSRLMIALAILDCIKRHGQTVQLLCDVINF